MMTVADIESTSVRLSQELQYGAPGRYRLLDMATALTLMASELRRAAEMESGASAEAFLVRTALTEVDDCISWLQWYGQAAPAQEVRERIARARRCTEHGLALLNAAVA